MKTQDFYPQRLLTCSLALLFTVSCAQTKFAPADLEQEVASGVAPNKAVSSTEIVAATNKQVDFLLVLDDSHSMQPELKKLSSRLANFARFLEASQIDWQMCVTTTRPSNGGAALAWKNYLPAGDPSSFVLKKGAMQLNGIFTSTIDSLVIGSGDSSDERGIKAAYLSFQNAGPCYRPGAAVSVIVISDEDERSVGGDPTKVKALESPGIYKPLEAEDLPQNLLAQAQASFGSGVRFTFNSIIVKPGDKACEASQDRDASPSHPGFIYAQMSSLTGGGVGSICDGDYGANLNTFKDKVVGSLSQAILQCEPRKGSLKVWVNQVPVSNFRVEKKTLKFNTDLQEGTRIDLTYECQD